MAMTKLAILGHLKHVTSLLGLAILMTSITAASAKIDKTCLRNVRELGIPPAQAKRVCNPQKAKPDEGDGAAMAAAHRTGSKAKALGSSAMSSANERLSFA
jgi:hypothetical protein